MVKQITATNDKTTAVYRFIGKLIYLKGNNSDYIEQLVSQLKSKGAEIRMLKGWAEVNIFGKNTYVKLGNITMDLSVMTPEEVQDILADFFKTTLDSSGMKCEVIDI